MAQIHPYLFFNGRCDEAIESYRRALGAEMQMAMRNKDAPPGVAPPLPPRQTVRAGCYGIGTEGLAEQWMVELVH